MKNTPPSHPAASTSPSSGPGLESQADAGAQPEVPKEPVAGAVVGGVFDPTVGKVEPVDEEQASLVLPPRLTPAPPSDLIEPGHIEPGRALALVDFSAPSVSFGEKLVRKAYRIGVPGAFLTGTIGKSARPRLLATVHNTLPGNRLAGTAIRSGHFLVHGAKTPIAQIDYAGGLSLPHPLEKVVHSFSWLTDLQACATREQAAPVAERILSAWLHANPTPPSKASKSPAWNVGYTGMRITNWLTHAPLILSGERSLRVRTLKHIQETARWLDRHVNKAEDRLAEVAAWCAIIATGLLMPEGQPRRLYGEEGLIKALGELVGDDGGVLSRSPLAQMEAIALLIQLRNCYLAIRREPLTAIERIIELLVPPLLALTHSDGGLGSWHGAWAVSEENLQALIKASGVRTRPLRDVRQWGYQRIAAQKSILQFDAAPPPMPAQARFGCASTLAFELSHGPYRLIVNCGGSASSGGLVPIRLEQGLRASAAHSTLTLNDANSTAILSGGMIGAGVAEVTIDRRTLNQEEGNATRLIASHNGYASRYGLTHQRTLLMRDDGTELKGEDTLIPTGKKQKTSDVTFAIRFHLGPDVEVSLADDQRGALLNLPDESAWHLSFDDEAPGTEVVIEDSLWIDAQGLPQATQQIILQGIALRTGANFGWVLRRVQ